MTAYRGTPVSAGVAAGELYLPDAPAAAAGAQAGAGAQSAAGTRSGAGSAGGPGAPGAAAAVTVTADDIRAAFAAVAADRHALAAQLRAAGRGDEADIVTIGALMAADPALSGPALDALAPPAPGPAAPGPDAGESKHAPVGDASGRLPTGTGPEPAAGGAERAPVGDDPGRFPLEPVAGGAEHTPRGDHPGHLRTGTEPAAAVPGRDDPGRFQTGTGACEADHVPVRDGSGSLPSQAAVEAERAPVRDDPGRFPLATAVAAIAAAAQAQAAILEALPDNDLAQRAGDVRQVAAAVAAALGGNAAAPPPRSPFILVRAEVDPADLIRLAEAGHLAGAVSAGGGASSHAAIIARGLGLPMLATADPAVTSAAAGQQAVLDADRGELLTDPAPADLARVPAAGARGPAAHGAARTAGGALVTILCNVASAAETRLGLSNGAAGVGLLRTEIPFTRAASWPTRAEHLAALAPVLRLLRGRRAVVRLLDFAGDKVPPFPGAAGLPAFLRAPGALAAQLAAILQAGAGTDLAVMIPMVRALDEVTLVRAELARAASAAGVDPPPLGMMVELAATAANAPAFAGSVDFFSIGTNDLTADVLHRERSALRPSDASEREVLTAVAHVVSAAGEAGIGLSVCGDAAADPAVLPRLLALGVRTVSVGAARVPAVAGWIAQAGAPGPAGPGRGGPAGPGPGGTAGPDAG